jgi:hypothetical protein
MKQNVLILFDFLSMVTPNYSSSLQITLVALQITQRTPNYFISLQITQRTPNYFSFTPNYFMHSKITLVQKQFKKSFTQIFTVNIFY